MQSIKNRLLWQYVGNLDSEANAKWSVLMEEINKNICCMLCSREILISYGQKIFLVFPLENQIKTRTESELG